MIVSIVDNVLDSTMVKFCYADTTTNYLLLERDNIFNTPTSAVLTSLLISCFLLFKSTLNTPVYSPPKTKVPFYKYNIAST